MIFHPNKKKNLFFYDMVAAVVERSTAELRVAGSIPARYKYLYGLPIVVPGSAVCVYVFSMFVNAPTIQEFKKSLFNVFVLFFVIL